MLTGLQNNFYLCKSHLYFLILQILYMLIEEVDKKLSGYTGVLTIMCKDFTSFKLRIPGIENAVNVCASIEALSTLGMSFFIMLVNSK